MDKIFIDIALEVLETTTEEVEKCSKELPEDHAVYFWSPERGGLAVIVAEDGTKLAASSAISFDEHIAAFREGMRN